MSKPNQARKRSYRALVAVLFLLVVGGGAFYAMRLLRGLELHPHPLANVPQDATAVLHVRVPNVLRSEALRILIRRELVEESLDKIRNDCGFDPTDLVSEVVFFADAASARDLDSVGVIAAGEFADRRVLDCVKSALRQEGLGDLTFYDIEGVPAAKPATGLQRIAFLGEHGVAIGAEPALAEVIRVIREDRPSAQAGGNLAHLWERLASGRDVVALVELPSNTETRLRDLQVDTTQVGPLTRQVRALGVAAAFSSGLELAAAVLFVEEAKAAEVATSLRGYLSQLEGNVLVSLTPFGPVVRALRVEQQGKELTLGISLPHDRLQRLFEFAMAWQSNYRNQEAGNDTAPRAVLPRTSIPGLPLGPGSPPRAPTGGPTAPGTAPQAPGPAPGPTAPLPSAPVPSPGAPAPRAPSPPP